MVITSADFKILKDTPIWDSSIELAEGIGLSSIFFAPFSIYLCIEMQYSGEYNVDMIRSIQVAPRDGSSRYSFINIENIFNDDQRPYGRRIILRISSYVFDNSKYYINYIINDKIYKSLDFEISGGRLIRKEYQAEESEITRCIKPLILSGTPKSGTTWLQEILNTYPNIFVMHEGNFFNFMLDRLWRAQCASLIGSAEWERYVRWRPESPHPLDYAEFVQVAVAKELFNAFSPPWGGFIADRTPGYALRYESMLARFPELRVIHIVRHPLDVLVSWIFHEIAIQKAGNAPVVLPPAALKLAALRLDANGGLNGPHAPLGAFSLSELDAVLDFWSDDQLAAARAARAFPGRVQTVRYEDIQGDFDTQVSRLYAFLGIDLAPASLDAIRSSTSFENMSGGRSKGQVDNYSFFRRGLVGGSDFHLSPSQIDYCWSKLGAIAATFGYQDPRGSAGSADPKLEG